MHPHQSDQYCSYMIPQDQQIQMLGSSQIMPSLMQPVHQQAYQQGMPQTIQSINSAPPYYFEHYVQQQQPPSNQQQDMSMMFGLQNQQPGYKIHVGNLPLTITQEELGQVFSKFGNVMDVKIIKKTSQGMPLHMFCYAFVAFDNAEAAESALGAGTVNDWTVKALIDKTKNSNQSVNTKRQRSRSRSRSKERDSNKRQKEQLSETNLYSIHQMQDIHRQIQPEQQDTSYRVLVPLETPIDEVESMRPVQVLVTVRELFVTGIPRDRDESFVRQLFSQFGAIEKVDMYPKTNIYYTYVKFFTIESAWVAFENSAHIQTQFTMPQFIKIYYSDPIKRSYIVGNNAQYENPKELTNVVFVYFPPHPSLKLDMKLLLQICDKAGCPVQAWQYNQQDPQYKSYLLLEFEDVSKAQYMRDYLGRNTIMLFGDDKTEVGILPDDSKFQQNPQHKLLQPVLPQYTTRQSQFRQQQQIKQMQQQNRNSQPSTPQQIQPPQPVIQPTIGFGILDELCPVKLWGQSRPPQQYYEQINQQTQSSGEQDDKFLKDMLSSFMVQNNQNPQYNDQYQDNNQRSQIQQFQQQYEEQEIDSFWSGFMMRSKSHRVGVDARMCEPQSQIEANIPLPYYLNVAYRANVEDALRRIKQGTKMILTPSNQTSEKEFEDYIKYFKEKSKVGVVQLENGATLYVIPPSKEIEPFVKLTQMEMLAIYVDPKTEPNKKLGKVASNNSSNAVSLNYNPDI